MTTIGSSMSKLYFSAISSTLLTPVRKPWLWRLYSAMNTCLTIVFSGMPATRRYNVNTFMCDCTLGGIAPTSSRVISLLVLDLTMRIHFKNQRNTLSISLFALGDTPHTSLPYRYMGFISVSKIYSISLGCRVPIFLDFLKIPKMAFWALSHKKSWIFFKNVSWTNSSRTNDITQVFVHLHILNNHTIKYSRFVILFSKQHNFGVQFVHHHHISRTKLV